MTKMGLKIYDFKICNPKIFSELRNKKRKFFFI